MTDRFSSISRPIRVTLVMCCVFLCTGAIMPYLARWLEVERGLVGAEIGAVVSLATLLRLFTGPAFGFWADGALDRRTPLRLTALAAVAAFAIFFFLARDFGALLLWGFVALTLMQAMTPFVEGALLRATASGRVSYGVARGFGSLAFIFASVACGAAIGSFGPGIVAVWVVCALAFASVAAFNLLPDPGSPGAGARPWAERLSSAGALFKNKRYFILIAACGLIQSGHAFYYTFSTLVWRGQGVGADIVGLLWGFGVLVEVAMLWSLPLIERHARPETLILLGAAGGVFRWICMGFAPLGVWVWALQALHALSFAATHIGAMRLLYRETPENAAGFAQTLYAAVGGVLMGLATIASGYLYDFGGAQGYWLMAVLGFGGGLLAAPLAARPARPHPDA